jgi:hypothetical protein
MAAENSSNNQSKEKTASKEKTPTKGKAPSVTEASGPHELPTHRTPTKSKSNKEAAVPAQNWDPPNATRGWVNPPDQDWTNPVNPVGSKPATKVSFKKLSKVPSQTASQKASQTPGSYPKSAFSHHTASEIAAAAADAARSAAKSAAKKSASKKSNQEEPAAAADAENWNQPQQDNTWDTAPAGAWDGGSRCCRWKHELVNSSFPLPHGTSNQKTKTKKKRSKVQQTERKTRKDKEWNEPS